MTADPGQPEPVGWQVIDPDGNVVASGPVTVMELVAEAGDVPQGRDDDGGD